MIMRVLFTILFCSGTLLAGSAEFGLPTVVTREQPVDIRTNAHGGIFLDFGRDAFGWLEISRQQDSAGGVLQVAVSEMRHDDYTVDCWCGGTIRSWQSGELPLAAGAGVFRVPFDEDCRNTDFSHDPPPVRLRPEIGAIKPFRYVEFYRLPVGVNVQNVRRAMVHYPIDMGESSFSCSDARLTTVYDFCKYSILATSFAGLYVDGDRERIPYEADAYINQLGHYAISSDGSLARATYDYLTRHSTWPSEWKQHLVRMAWADWMWTGSTNGVAQSYDLLKSKMLLLDRKRPDGLLCSRPQGFPGPGRSNDIVDWPPRDRDGYVFCPASAVVNAFHYRNLMEMSDMARAIGRVDDAAWFAEQVGRVRDAYLRVFRDPQDGLFKDGEGTEHKGLHANALALAFGLVPEQERGRVADWLVSKGVACGVYFTQYLLEALFIGGRDKSAIGIMTSDSNRSWLGMLRQGATITMEAWNRDDKPNLDWNHAWGTPPLNVMARYVLGVSPLSPGFEKISVRPKVGDLREVVGVVPTVKGPITVAVKSEVLQVTVPSSATVEWKGRSYEVDSGRHVFRLDEVGSKCVPKCGKGACLNNL